MGLFDFLKPWKNIKNPTTDNGVLGPTYLEDVTEHIIHPSGLQVHEWRRQLMTKEGQTQFKIKYYGQLHEECKDLITRTDFSAPLIYAVDPTNNQHILLWDGCQHGYNPLFCDEFSSEQINSRVADTFYIDEYGKDLFEIVISTYNQYDFDEEMGDEVDENGYITVDEGKKMKFDEAKRNGFDCLEILVINEDEKITNIVSEELA